MDEGNEAQQILLKKVIYLERENQILKELLHERGIEYEKYLQKACGAAPEKYDPNQGARIKPLVIEDDTPAHFYKRFWGRQDVYELRYTNWKTGKTGYYTQCANFWSNGCHKRLQDKVQCRDCEYKAYKPITKEVVLAHLKGQDPRGNDVLAIYPMLPGNYCRFLVFDFDDHAGGTAQDDYANQDEKWKEEVDSLREICRLLKIDYLVERSRSGRGAHLWVFFSKPILAKTARQFGFALLNKGAEAVNLKSFRYFDRMLPNQDVLPEGGLGNVIALPLQGKALTLGNSAFIDENWNAYPDQLKALWNTEMIPPELIENYIRDWNASDPDHFDENDPTKPWERRDQFEAADVNGNAEIDLSNMVYINSKNLQPRIQNQVRRLAAFSNPEFYKNQAIGFSNYKESRYIYLGKG